MRAFSGSWWVALAVASSGCVGLRVQMIDHSVRKPSNVAVYFTVDRADGTPVPGLTADSFRIYEDGQPVSVLESRQTILNREVAAVHHTLLLMDMSGSVTGSGEVPQLQEAARAFTSRVEQFQRVGIYAFEGSPDITPIVGSPAPQAARRAPSRRSLASARATHRRTSTGRSWPASRSSIAPWRPRRNPSSSARSSSSPTAPTVRAACRATR
jgi:hypothetical protein